MAVMKSDRQRIEDDLRGIIRGSVDCDPITTSLFASDASIYQIQPAGVVRPRSASDIAATIQYAAEHDLSVHPRGTGSGIAGDSLGSGIILDLSRYMRRIRPSADFQLAHVESGATLAELNRSLKPSQRWFGPDPITRSITTMGSVIARNAAGSHYRRSGSARDNVEEIRFITAGGETLTLGKHLPGDETPESRLARGLCEIRDQFTAKLQCDELVLRSMAYRLDDIVGDDGRVDLAKFVAGSQGTLGVIASATVTTETVPTHRGVVLLFFHRLDMAVRSAISALDHGVVACDWMDRRLLQIARETDDQFRALLPPAAEAMVLIEIQGESLGDLYDRLAIIRQSLSRGHDGAFEAVETVEQAERDRYWALSRRVIPRLYRLTTDTSPQPFIEDLRLPHHQTVDAIAEIQDILRSYDTAATMFGQTGRGTLHIRPFLNLSLAADRKRLGQLSGRIAEAVGNRGGVVGADHAAGLSKSALLPQQYGDLWQAMGQVKRLFDPAHRMNPGRVFGAVLQRVNENLRPSDRRIEIVNRSRVLEEADETWTQVSRDADRSIASLPVLQHWPPGGEVTAVVRTCNGCGRCRTTAKDQRQCPVYRAIPSEESSPRAKANLLRAVISGELPAESLTTDAAKAVADLCFNCHQCRLECPASVDVPKIVGELKAQYVAGNGQTLSDAFLARIDSVVGFASIAPRTSNWLIASRMGRWLAERAFGLSSARELPPIARETFLRHASRRKWNRQPSHGGLKVCYFVDHFANYHDPDIGKALGEVLQQNEVILYVPSGQRTSGMARITMGDVIGARKIARRNVRILADAVRNGYTIVATEPSAVLCLKHEYPNLLGDEDSLLVAEHTMEAAEYLWHLHQGDRLSLEFSEVQASVAYHHPCHLRVLDPEPITTRLLSLVPGLQVEGIEAGCTGMAGTWGLQKKNYRNSLRIGWPLISAMRAAPASMATTACGACRMQIEHGADQSTIHPIKLLAYAYGRMTKIQKQLEAAS